jgi:hypothetical protein
MAYCGLAVVTRMPQNHQPDRIPAPAPADRPQVEDHAKQQKQVCGDVHIEGIQVPHVKKVAEQRQGKNANRLPRPSGACRPEAAQKETGRTETAPMQNAHDANIEGSVLGKNPIDGQGRHNYQQLRGLVPGLPTIAVVEGVPRVGMLENVGGSPDRKRPRSLAKSPLLATADYGRQNELPDSELGLHALIIELHASGTCLFRRALPRAVSDHRNPLQLPAVRRFAGGGVRQAGAVRR